MFWVYEFEIEGGAALRLTLCPYHAMRISRLGYVLYPIARVPVVLEGCDFDQAVRTIVKGLPDQSIIANVPQSLN